MHAGKAFLIDSLVQCML